MTEQTIEQLRTELAQMQLDANAVCQSLNIKWAQDGNYPEFAIRAIEKLRGKWARKEWERDEIQAELAKIRTDLTDACAARDALAVQRYGMEYAHERTTELLEGRNMELMQVRKELKGLQGANQALGQRMAAFEESRDYWYDIALDAEAERDKVHKEAQAQSDEVQRDWLSPCQKAGLEGLVKALREQLKHAEDVSVYWLKEHDELETGLAAGRGAVAKATEALERAAAREAAIVETAKVLLEQSFIEVGHDIQQAAKVGNAKMELRRAIWYRSEAAAKLLERLATLDAAEAALADARRVARLWFRRAQEAELAAHVHGKSCSELAQIVRTERQLRQEAERRAESYCQTILSLHRILDKYQIPRKRDHAGTIDRVLSLAQRATRAEALAQPVTPELERLLERLAKHTQELAEEKIDIYAAPLSFCMRHWLNDAKSARKLAAQIREALALEANDEG